MRASRTKSATSTLIEMSRLAQPPIDCRSAFSKDTSRGVATFCRRCRRLQDHLEVLLSAARAILGKKQKIHFGSLRLHDCVRVLST